MILRRISPDSSTNVADLSKRYNRAERTSKLRVTALIHDHSLQARKKGGVLVHCFAGQSRSAALVAAYLISREYQLSSCYASSHMDAVCSPAQTVAWWTAGEGLDTSAALSLIRKTRPFVQPNTGFMRQLHTYSQMLDGASPRGTLDESTEDTA